MQALELTIIQVRFRKAGIEIKKAGAVFRASFHLHGKSARNTAPAFFIINLEETPG